MIDANECELPAERVWEVFRYGFKHLWKADYNLKSM